MNELAAVDEYCDAVPRSAATVEDFGSLRLFVPTEASFHPWYARPVGGRPIPAVDLDAVLRRQRELGLPVAVEWVDGRPPGLTELATAAGLAVRRHPLLVARSDEMLPLESQVDVRIVADDLDRVESVGAIAFGDLGGQTPGDPVRSARRAARVASGHPVVAAAYVDGAPVARGRVTVVDAVAEITGVATLAAFRRQGIGAAVTAVLAEEAVRRGARLLWLSATDAVVARLYSRLGFREIGTACVASG